MKNNFRQRLYRISNKLLATLFACCLFAQYLVGCSVLLTSASFTEVESIEKQLKRGVSTRMDVQRLLGLPQGSGGAILPPNSEAYDVLYYEDVVVLGTKADSNPVSNYLNLNFRQQILLIFLRRDKFEGYLWTSNMGIGHAE